MDDFLKRIWCIPLKNENSKTVTHAVSNILSTSKRSPLKKRKRERGRIL